MSDSMTISPAVFRDDDLQMNMFPLDDYRSNELDFGVHSANLDVSGWDGYAPSASAPAHPHHTMTRSNSWHPASHTNTVASSGMSGNSAAAAAAAAAAAVGGHSYGHGLNEFHPMSPSVSPPGEMVDSYDEYLNAAAQSKRQRNYYNLQLQTPVRKRAGSAIVMSSGHPMPMGSFEETGLITPVSAGATPRNPARGKLEFMTPFQAHYPHSPPMSSTSPMETGPAILSYEGVSMSGSGPVAAPNTPRSSPQRGYNPFYCLPSCMRTSEHSQGTSPVQKPVPTTTEAMPISPRHSVDYSYVMPGELMDDSEPTEERPVAIRQNSYESVYDSPPPGRPEHHEHKHVARESLRDASPCSSDEGDGKPEKPFACSECRKPFRRMEHLRRHAKIHTKERPYSCDIPGCERKFSRSDNLKAHMKTHTKRSGRNIYVEGLELVSPEPAQSPPKKRKLKA